MPGKKMHVFKWDTKPYTNKTVRCDSGAISLQNLDPKKRFKRYKKLSGLVLKEKQPNNSIVFVLGNLALHFASTVGYG